ncbi:M50 family metallopeptidase [Amphibacillus sediminis]|uniref:M50 family metallopeptidase n=1 Tax=Amphibacillus sediminis TaxID=360185 RepID=UPI0008295446|nr:M50 family metallopeptidase [Amphibacillus sediminis]
MNHKVKRLLFVVMFIVIFFLIGFFMAIYFDTNDMTFNISISNIVVSYLLFLVVGFVVINLHELGHFLFGRLLGYQLITYRIGMLSLTKENGKLKLEWIKNKGYGGLCAMIPPKDSNPYDKKHLYFYAGGILLNLLTGLIAIPALRFVSGYGQTFLFIFIFWSIIMGLLNLIPLKTSGNIHSDGKIIWGILLNDPIVAGLLAAMAVNVQMAGGVRPKALHLPDNSMTNHEPSLLLFNYYAALDEGDLERLPQLVEQIERRLNDFSTFLLPAIYYELVMAGCILDDQRLVNQYYPLAHQTLKRDRDLNGERIKAYYAFECGDLAQAKTHIDKGRMVAKKFPLPGQIEMELTLLDRLEQRIKA